MSPGCDNCYAAAQDKFRKWTTEGWGGPRKRTSEALWRQPLKWNSRDFVQCADCGWRGDHEDFMQQDTDGLRSRCSACGHQAYIAARRRVFCASLADVFDNQVPIEWRRDLFDLIELTPNLDWLLLTKRIGNVADMVREARSWDWMLGRQNVWLGATVVNQQEADRDIPKLLATPAAVRFLSMEPLLGPVDLRQVAVPREHDQLRRAWDVDGYKFNTLQLHDEDRFHQPPAKLDWVIVGFESGTNARAGDPDWARSLRDQCAVAGVPLHFKQWGKQAAGRVLDGVTHDEFPRIGVRGHDDILSERN